MVSVIVPAPLPSPTQSPQRTTLSAALARLLVCTALATSGLEACAGATNAPAKGSGPDKHPPSKPRGPAPKDAALGKTTRIALGTPAPSSLPVTVEPVTGERALLLVASAAGERETWVRWIDESGKMSPALRLWDERVSSAFTTPEGKRSLLTADGERLCLVRYRGEALEEEARACERADAKALAVVEDRVALISVGNVDPPKEARPASPAAKTKKPKTNKKKKPEATRKPAKPKPPVEVFLRWATAEGFEEPIASGLTFTPPLDGMGVVDAIGVERGVLVAWFETSKPSPGKKAQGGALGWGAIGAGLIDEEGQFDPKSRKHVVEGEVDWGFLRGFFSPRLIRSGTGIALLTQQAARGGVCEVTRPGAATEGPQRASCAIEPGKRVDVALLKAFEKLVEVSPRRTTGQLKSEPGLVVWAGDRGYFVTGDGTHLFSAGRDGAVKEQEAPFPAKRERIAWAGTFVDGTGAALVGERVFSLNAAGELREGAAKAELFALARGAGEAQLARVGESIWFGRGDIGQVVPTVLAPEVWRGKGGPEGTALVGGETSALWIELSGGRLFTAGLFPEGKLGRPRAEPSPVRPGFSATERRAGGAIVVGVAAAHPAEVITFVVDAAGRVGKRAKTSLEVGDWRLTPLPSGGALGWDSARQHVVWLDDEAREVAVAAWPKASGEAALFCREGLPGKRFFPGITPGSFHDIDALAEPGTCLASDPVWALDGSLRFFALKVFGRDVLPEVRIVQNLEKPVERKKPEPLPEETVGASAPRPCPPEMVLVDGKLCVDRYEASIVDAASGEQLSPDYPVTPHLMDIALGDWATGRSRVGGLQARALPVPLLPAWQRGQKLDLLAIPRRLARPNGYVTGLVAESACAAAGKRLCTLPEFVLACRGDGDTPFPYGDTYVDGACNVNRDTHPAAVLHDNASIGHLDPRLNRVEVSGAPLFRRTGATPTCASRWGHDALFDMVGNLDEWVDEGGGAFAGGFYARSPRSGCDAVITAHPKNYLDYSTGVRCCKDAAK